MDFFFATRSFHLYFTSRFEQSQYIFTEIFTEIFTLKKQQTIRLLFFNVVHFKALRVLLKQFLPNRRSSFLYSKYRH